MASRLPSMSRSPETHNLPGRKRTILISIYRAKYSCARRFASLFVLAFCLVPLRAQAQTLPSGWSASDIGNPQIAGSATFSNNIFTVTGAGSDVWGSGDEFRFVYRQLTGDGVVVARVDSLQKAHIWSKAGVMIRETLGAGSKNAFTLVSAAKGLAFQTRVATSGATTSTVVPDAAPRWVRVARSGAAFTSSVSADGATWQTIGTASITMGSTVYVGLAVNSHSSSTTSTAAFSGVSVTTS